MFGPLEPIHVFGMGDNESAESELDTKELQRPLRRRESQHVLRGGTAAALGSTLTLLLMAHPGTLRWGVPLAATSVIIAVVGVMDLLGTFNAANDRVDCSVPLRALVAPTVATIAAWLLFCVALSCAQADCGLPQVAWGITITAAFVAGVATLFALQQKLGPWGPEEHGEARPLWKRHGFWLLAIAASLYFPCMGTYSLTDPWESQYGEVAREILARDDWISLWWAHENWFWSKPVLDMWMQALAMAALGVHYQPDKMLIGDGTYPVMHPEWAVRAPIVLLSLLALYLFYKGASKTFGRRAALFGALVLATTPLWCFITRQTMTDMSFVGSMTACMGLVLIGLHTPEDREVRVIQVNLGWWRPCVSGWHVVFGAILVCALPQIFYLASRNIELVWRLGVHGLRPHWDEFRSGSGGGNCGLPGSPECKQTLAAFIPHSVATPQSVGDAIWRAVGAFEPTLQAVLWAVLLGVVLYLGRRERRARRLYYLVAWLFAALSTLGKGPAGFGLPMLISFAYLCASRPGDDMARRIARVVREIVQFEIVSGLLIVCAVALPWYIAMYVRHGSPFTDRLIFHDMLNRFMSQIEDRDVGDDTSFRYYLWQLGYGLFPWTGLAPLGFLWWMRRGNSAASDRRSDGDVFLFLWFLISFALFAFMGTKFHYYIFPAVPPVAMLIGVLLDDVLQRRMANDLPCVTDVFPRDAWPARSSCYLSPATSRSSLRILISRAPYA